MKIQALHACTAHTIRGHYWRTFFAVLLYPAAWFILRLTPCILAAVLIQSGRMTARMLLTDVPLLWVLFSLFWAAFRSGILLPLRLASDGWMLSRFGLFPPSADAVCFRSARAYFRAFWFFLCMEIFRLLALLPFLLGLSGAVLAFRYSIGLPDGGMPLFIAAQCLCFAIASGGYYLHYSLGMRTAPLLFLRNPNISPAAAVRRSACILQNRRIAVLLLRMCKILAVIILPILPYALMNETLFLEVSIREQEQREELQYARPILYHEPPEALPA